jgi:polyhydroxybutyrate depolymerase
MLSSTIIAALLAIGSALGSNGYGNTIDSRFDKLSDRTDKYTLYQVISQPDAVPAVATDNLVPNQPDAVPAEATDNLVPSQPDAEPVEASLSSSESPAQEYSVKERCERYTMKNQGLEREYYLYRPEGLKAGAPLVIVLHGYGGSALKGKKAMMDVADKNGFAVCYPQGIKDPKGKPGWNVRYPSQEGMKTDDVKFLIALSKELQKRFDLSPKNTFLTGMSNGGDIIYLIAMRAPKAFKAMASIAGLQFNWMETEYSYKHPLPFMEVHGTQDHTSEWLGDPENKGGWGAYIPVPAAVSRIIAVNGCTEEYVTELPRREGRNQVTLYQFKAGRPAVKGGRPTEVWLYKVEGGNHSWSDKDMDTCSEIWRFFSQWID